MEEYIDLCHYQTQEKITVKAKRTGKEGQYLTNCINPEHEDKDPSMGINVIEGVYNCLSQHDARGVTWERHLREKGKSYKQKSNKKHLKEAEDKEIKSDIYMGIDTDINNWEGYDDTAKEEVRTRLPYDLCFIPEDERTIAMGAIVKAKIFRITELKSRVRKVKQMLKKQKESVKEVITPTKVLFNPKPYAEKVFKDFHFKADEFNRFYIYDSRNGVYRERAEVYLRHYLRNKYLEEKDLKRYCVSEIVSHIRDLSFLDIEEIEGLIPPLNLIPFANCIYDIDTGKQIEYSPDYFFTTKLKVKFNPKAVGCPTIDKIFHEIVKEEDVITLYEIPAYIMHRAYPYPKINFLYGSGGNGKSAYANILTRLVGSRNISTENSYDLQNNRFSGGNLLDKFINIATEMEYSVIKNTTILKQLTGEDLIRCERKYGRVFHFYNHAKQIFMGNAIPESVDTSFGFYRRVLLLEFPNRFIIGKNADPNLVRNLPEEEIEGLAQWALIKHKELKNKGFVFTRHEETDKIGKEYEALSNPLAKFLEDYCDKDYREEIFCDEFYEKFKEYLEGKEMRLISHNIVGRKMTTLGHKANMIIREKKKASAYLGLKWK